MRWRNGRRGGGIEDRRPDPVQRRVNNALVRARETAGGAFDSRISDYGQTSIRDDMRARRGPIVIESRNGPIPMSSARQGRRPGTTYTMGRR